MRILNLISVNDKRVEIIRSFPVIEEQLSHEVIQEAETALIERVFGILNTEIHPDDVFRIIDTAYTKGARAADGSVYLLLWSDIDV